MSTLSLPSFSLEDVKYYVQRFATLQPYLTAALLLVGVTRLAVFLTAPLRAFYGVFLGGHKHISKYRKEGSWAVVTGATDGIGLEFAHQLAKNKFNIFLVSRDSGKLSKVAFELQQKHGVSVATHAIDLNHPSEHLYEEFGNALASKSIAVLVNNVGKSHQYPENFVDTSIQDIHDIVNINITATLRVTKIVLPELLKQKKGIVINMGSFSGMFPAPLLATYGASKAFLVHFTRSLQSELKGTKVDVVLLNTYFITGSMSKIRRSSTMIPSPSTYVKSALSNLQPGDGIVGAPHWSHAFLERIIAFIGVTNPMFVSYVKNLHVDIRRRALKKLKRQE